jgi:hypothetical protein
LTSREPLEGLTTSDTTGTGSSRSVLPVVGELSQARGVQGGAGCAGNRSAGHRGKRSDGSRHVSRSTVGTGRRLSSGHARGEVTSLSGSCICSARNGSRAGTRSCFVGRLGNTRELRPFRGLQTVVKGSVRETLSGLSKRSQIKGSRRG